MKRRTRIVFFLAAAAGFAAVYGIGLSGMPPFGDYRGPYGYFVNAIAVPERHITDAVSAVNFDIRGFDTLGEEFIMFTSVAGVLVLLRRLRDESNREEHDESPERSIPPAGDAGRVITLGVVGLLTLYGLYIMVHGQMTPGGGFQGGVILATAPFCVYLAGNFRKFRKVANHHLVEIAEALGAGGYALIGVAGLVAGAAFLQNIVPLGKAGDVLSGGTVALIDIAVGIEVAAGFVLLGYQFLEETLEHGSRGRK